jgi:nucleoside-diphosphate-sugar epimerase
MSKRYLITGANGFIGKYLTEELCKISNDVFVCFKQHANDIQTLSNNLKYINMDMMSKKQVNEAIYDSKPDVIFHLAAQMGKAHIYYESKFNWKHVSYGCN